MDYFQKPPIVQFILNLENMSILRIIFDQNIWRYEISMINKINDWKNQGSGRKSTVTINTSVTHIEYYSNTLVILWKLFRLKSHQD